jgi:hypothetical protein
MKSTADLLNEVGGGGDPQPPLAEVIDKLKKELPFAEEILRRHRRHVTSAPRVVTKLRGRVESSKPNDVQDADEDEFSRWCADVERRLSNKATYAGGHDDAVLEAKLLDRKLFQISEGMKGVASQGRFKEQLRLQLETRLKKVAELISRAPPLPTTGELFESAVDRRAVMSATQQNRRAFSRTNVGQAFQSESLQNALAGAEVGSARLTDPLTEVEQLTDAEVGKLVSFIVTR